MVVITLNKEKLMERKLKIAFIDYETTGLNGKGAILRKGGSITNFCRPVSLCYIIADEDNNVTVDRYDEIIPIDENGSQFESSKDALATHGITKHHGLEFGIDCKAFHEECISDLKDVDVIVAHNGTSFDRPVFVATCIRLGLVENREDNTACEFMPLEKNFDTMKEPDIKAWVDARNVKGHKKAPNMGELHEKCFNTNFKDAHNAHGDVIAMKNCFFHMLNAGIISLDRYRD